MVEGEMEFTENLPAAITAEYRLLSCYQYADKKQTYLIQRRTDGLKMILKCARQEYKMFLEAEARLLKEKRFSFLPAYISYYEEEDGVFLFREYIEGSTIWDIVEKHGPFEQREALLAFKKIINMLKMLHSENPPVIHRDLKPQNIVLTARGECYLIDMGTARQFEEDKQQDTVVVGTRMVAAPEQFGYSQTDERTDIYAFGILMHYMMTGSMRVMQDRTLPRRLRKIILKCTAFNPEQRYQNMSQIERQLDKLLSEHGKRHRIRMAAEAVVVAAALFICAGYGAGQMRQRTNPTARFADTLLEEAVRRELGKAQGETIYVSELAGVRQLLVCGSETFSDYGNHDYYMRDHRVNYEPVEGHGTIQDISLLKEMPNLRILMLDGQEITDITPLQDLEKLELVSLCDCPISDITPLQNSMALSELYIAQTKVSDISALAGKEQLKALDVSYTQVTTLEPVSDLDIEILRLYDITLNDYADIETLPLRELRGSSIPAAGLQAIAGIGSMETLTLYGSDITDLNLFGSLSQLTYLDVWSNHVRSLDGVENLSSLTQLNVGSNPITEIELPSQLQTQLTFIGIRNSGVKDMSFLADMPNLTQIDVDSEQESLIYELMPQPPFQVSVME